MVIIVDSSEKDIKFHLQLNLSLLIFDVIQLYFYDWYTIIEVQFLYIRERLFQMVKYYSTR